VKRFAERNQAQNCRTIASALINAPVAKARITRERTFGERTVKPMAVPAIAHDVVAKPISDASNISFMV
jgi:hypothetical protein